MTEKDFAKICILRWLPSSWWTKWMFSLWIYIRYYWVFSKSYSWWYESSFSPSVFRYWTLLKKKIKTLLDMWGFAIFHDRKYFKEYPFKDISNAYFCEFTWWGNQTSEIYLNPQGIRNTILANVEKAKRFNRYFKIAAIWQNILC